MLLRDHSLKRKGIWIRSRSDAAHHKTGIFVLIYHTTILNWIQFAILFTYYHIFITLGIKYYGFLQTSLGSLSPSQVTCPGSEPRISPMPSAFNSSPKFHSHYLSHYLSLLSSLFSLLLTLSPPLKPTMHSYISSVTLDRNAEIIYDLEHKFYLIA